MSQLLHVEEKLSSIFWNKHFFLSDDLLFSPLFLAHKNTHDVLLPLNNNSTKVCSTANCELKLHVYMRYFRPAIIGFMILRGLQHGYTTFTKIRLGDCYVWSMLIITKGTPKVFKGPRGLEYTILTTEKNSIFLVEQMSIEISFLIGRTLWLKKDEHQNIYMYSGQLSTKSMKWPSCWKHVV